MSFKLSIYSFSHGTIEFRFPQIYFFIILFIKKIKTIKSEVILEIYPVIISLNMVILASKF